MIKNIIFDMGNVLIEFRPLETCKQFAKNDSDIEFLHYAVFCSQEWLMLDIGMISNDEAIKRVIKRVNRPDLNEAIENCFNNWITYTVKEINGMKQVLKELKDEGYNLYILSNASKLMSKNQNVISGIEHFTKTFFSADYLMIKPQKEIYHTFLKAFSLKSDECFFIDDLQMNIDSASTCGIKGFCYDTIDIEIMKKVLKNINNN